MPHTSQHTRGYLIYPVIAISENTWSFDYSWQTYPSVRDMSVLTNSPYCQVRLHSPTMALTTYWRRTNQSPASAYEKKQEQRQQKTPSHFKTRTEGWMENECAECGVRSMENDEYGKCRVWKMRSTENEVAVLLQSRKKLIMEGQLNTRLLNLNRPFIMNFLRLYNKSGTLPMLVFSTAEHQQGVVCNQILESSNISPKIPMF